MLPSLLRIFKATLKFLMHGIKEKFSIRRIYTSLLIEQNKPEKCPGITEAPRLNYVVDIECYKLS